MSKTFQYSSKANVYEGRQISFETRKSTPAPVQPNIYPFQYHWMQMEEVPLRITKLKIRNLMFPLWREQYLYFYFFPWSLISRYFEFENVELNVPTLERTIFPFCPEIFSLCWNSNLASKISTYKYFCLQTKLAQFDEVIIGLVQLAAINNSCICISES